MPVSGNPIQSAAREATITTETISPVVLVLTVACSPARAFDYFARDIAKWWPLAKYSVCEEQAVGVAIEPQVGGRIIETDQAGNIHVWGHVNEWRPPHRLRFTWHPGHDASTAQWVEVTFAVNPKGTLVSLAHGGWEALGERGLPTRDTYAGGWQVVMGTLYAAYVTTAETAGK